MPSWSPTTISLDKRLPGTALSAAPKPAQQARIVFNGNADDDDMEPEETETFPKGKNHYHNSNGIPYSKEYNISCFKTYAII